MSYQSEMENRFPGWKPRKPEDLKADYAKHPTVMFLQSDAVWGRV